VHGKPCKIKKCERRYNMIVREKDKMRKDRKFIKNSKI